MSTIRPRVLVTRRLLPEVEARIARLFDATLNADDHVMPVDEIIAAAAKNDALLVTPGEKCRADFLDRLPPSIKAIATFSVGYDHIDVPHAKAKGLAIANTPDVLTDATADIALLLMLGAARGASWGEDMIRNDKWNSWSPSYPLGLDVTGQRLGILGMGRIGQAVAKRARAFDMQIRYHNRSRIAAANEHGAAYCQTFEEMLPHCDFLSINCASTVSTRNIVNAKTIALLPKGAIVVNSARGDIVDDDALIAAVKSGHLGAVGLDVYKNEPAIDSRYRTLEKAFLLPHLGSATLKTRIAMGMKAVDNLEDFFAGRRPRDLLTG